MPIDAARVRDYLKAFDFRNLFIEELGWNRPRGRAFDVEVEGRQFRLDPAAEKLGVQIFVCAAEPDGPFPDYATQRKIDKAVTKLAHEHLIIFMDDARTTQVWQWVARAPGRPAAYRHHTWHKDQSGDALVEKLKNITFTLDEEESLTLSGTTLRLKDAFDRDRVTKRFYDRFSDEHKAFSEFIAGIADIAQRDWYASLMLNRLMFVYFIQRKGFLDGNIDYLADRLRRVQAEVGKGKFHSFYRRFLRRLFHEGLGKSKPRGAELDTLLGDIPYLNGGLFDVHELEEAHPEIDIPDEAFEKLFEFFGAYDWHLDDRPLSSGSEINPDVLGYIFEKYINQKQMGAYYTKEDITEYIAKNTVIPHLLERTRERCKVAFEGEASVWSLLAADPDRYIYPAMKRGVIDARGKVVPESALPDFVQTGMHDAKVRMFDRRYNLGEAVFETASGERGTLPTETWREYVERRNRCLAIHEKLARGEVREADDLVTLNLDIRQFMQDVIEQAGGPELLRAVWQAIVGRVPEKANEKFRHGITILDPTCGSGAFLFAALNILEPLYEACIERMQGFIEDSISRPQAGEGSGVRAQFTDFQKTLAEIAQHPSPRYYIYKSIILHNLFGVDIMPEAVEICKLRLFLKLVSQVDATAQLEPLPDIDFNIRAGNTLVGYATIAQLRASANLASDPEHLKEIEARAADLSDAFDRFREQQTVRGGKVTAEDKRGLRERLSSLADELDRYLAREYGVDPDKKKALAAWQTSHQPFHWFAEFNGVMAEGGFDVVIGNPPYVELRLVRSQYRLQGYQTEEAGNLYAVCMERSSSLVKDASSFGMIVPAGLMGLDDSRSLRHKLISEFNSVACSTYAIRPSKLFDGVDQRLCIFLGRRSRRSDRSICTTRYHHWNTNERATLFQRLVYVQTPFHERLKVIPQIGSPTAATVLYKLESFARRTAAHLYARSGVVLHYHRSPRYWIRAMDFEQYFQSATRSRSVHHFRDLMIRDQAAAHLVGSIINSSLFFFWFLTVGNGRNITGRDIEQFPVGSSEPLAGLDKLFSELMEDYKGNSIIRERRDCSFQEFRPSLSKSIIDKIDVALGKLYGFTDEETDFIINYDIKYRIGGADEEEVE